MNQYQLAQLILLASTKPTGMTVFANPPSTSSFEVLVTFSGIKHARGRASLCTFCALACAGMDRSRKTPDYWLPSEPTLKGNRTFFLRQLH